VKGINFSGYARLVDAANETAKQAALGIEPVSETPAAGPLPPFVVQVAIGQPDPTAEPGVAEPSAIQSPRSG